ncbi:helix-turn-helix domain-containing protein [Plantactinospora sp. B24E8]|uniref:helix-turn-helix domain-containing protein n=1 Tax=Plantactinospora sp. B24E8 TaxID=3153567 RepID=UPI00325F40E8
MADERTSEPAESTPAITDLNVLRAITNPIRFRLYEVLATRGPATAARLAEYVSAAPGSLSYHLRQLAAAGYVEEAPDLGGDARERWWRAVPGGIRFSPADFLDTPAARAAVDAAQQLAVGRRLDRLRRWQETAVDRWGAEWLGAAVSSDMMLYLTPDELRQFGAEVGELIDRWAERSRDHRAAQSAQGTASAQSAETGSDSGREEIFLFVHGFPVDPSEEPRP